MGGVVDFADNLLFGPDQPDPAATAQAQMDINKQAAYESAALNQINQIGPGYNISYTGEIGDPNRTMTYTLDPQREALAQQLNQQMLTQAGLIGGPVDYSGVTPIPAYGDYGEYTQGMVDDMYAGMMSRIMPEMQKTWDQQTTLAANKGLPMGGEAYNDVQESLNRQQQDLMMGAAAESIGLGMTAADQMYAQQMAAHQQGMQDIYSDRGLMANEMALMHNMNPYTGTQVMSPTQYQISPADQMGMEAAMYNADVANQASMIGGLSSLGGAYILGSALSDRRLKQDIELVGTTYGGVPIYSFRYKGGKLRHNGVMAQDMLFINPDAVSMMDNGYMAVDYSKVI